MFARFDIPENHKIVLTQVVRTHDYVTESLLAQLYRAAADALGNDKTSQPDVRSSLIEAKDLRIGAATDEKTGIFMWLVDTPKGRLMTIGAKWAAEQHDPATSTTSSKVW